MKEIAYNFEHLSRLPSQGTIWTWSYFSFVATELKLLFDEKWAFSYNGRFLTCERRPYTFLLQIKLKNIKMGPWALASSVSILSAVRSFLVDKLFYFSSLSTVASSRSTWLWGRLWANSLLFSPFYLLYWTILCIFGPPISFLNARPYACFLLPEFSTANM
jgi:hypothetical protein